MAPQQCRVLLPGVGEVFIPLPVSSLDALRAAVKGHFNVLDGQVCGRSSDHQFATVWRRLLAAVEGTVVD
jgi:hypothetical protein